MGLQKWIENLRKWIDEEEPAEEHAAPRPRSKWEDFLVAVAREVEQTMLREMFTPPGGPTYIPREYIVFLSPADDSEWQGEKREGLERGLHYVLSERAKELVGENQFQTKSFAVELRVDATLDQGRFKVQHIWDAETQKTIVRPRGRSEPAAARNADAGPLTAPDDEATVVRPRKSQPPLFSVSVKGKSPLEEPAITYEFHKPEITIGRGSRQIEVDLRLQGDPEVSRKHATLTLLDSGLFKLSCTGANAIVIGSDREIKSGESTEIKSGDKILICSHELVIGKAPPSEQPVA